MLLGAVLCGLAPGTARAAFPAGFVDVTLPISLSWPTAFAFAPDGSILITTKEGGVHVVRDELLVAPAALTLPPEQICTGRDAGILGLAIDPDFAANGHFYLAYSFERPDRTCVNRVSRFTLIGDAAQLASESVLLDNMPGAGNIHDAGMLEFGPDGLLYASIGDGGADYAGGGTQGGNDAARDLNALTGKMLRITRDGAIPAGNPYQGPETARCHLDGRTSAGTICQEIVATGLRNPFRFAIDPNAAPDVRLFINDVGFTQWEEIDRFELGADYGWNCFEGLHPLNTEGPCAPTPAGLTAPIFEYRHNVQIPGTRATGCGSITGAAFVPDGLWPGFDGAYLFTDSNCGEILRLSESDAGTFAASDFGADLPAGTVHLRFGPYLDRQALYYLNVYDGSFHRVFHDSNDNDQPSASLAAAPHFGLAPLAVSFDASASGDPDAGDELSYVWDFGDGTPPTVTTSPFTVHTYAAGVYAPMLWVRDQALWYSVPSFTWLHSGNRPPEVSITTPAAGASFSVGETIVLNGSATDPEDGVLEPGALSWRIVRRHEAHTHAFAGPLAGNGVDFVAPAPEDLSAAATSHLVVQLTATDSWGLPATVERAIQPRRVPLTLTSEPSGLRLTVAGTPVVTPATLVSWQGHGVEVAAPDQELGDDRYVWRTWSDGGPRSHVVTTGPAPEGVSARFLRSLDSGPLSFFTLPPCRLVDTRAAEAPALAAGSIRRFAAAGRCGVPAAARALAVNLTVASSGAAGQLQVWAAGEPSPETTALSVAAGQVRAGQHLLGLGADGAFDAALGAAAGSANLIVDVSGYFVTVED